MKKEKGKDLRTLAKDRLIWIIKRKGRSTMKKKALLLAFGCLLAVALVLHHQGLASQAKKSDGPPQYGGTLNLMTRVEATGWKGTACE